MSFQNEKLSPFVIAEMFKNSLVLDSLKEKVSAKKGISDADVYHFLGNNAKNICLVFDHPNVPFVPDQHLPFLTRILASCNLNLGDVAIINHSVEMINIHSLRQQLNPSKILLFGIAPATLMVPIDSEQFNEQKVDGCSFLFAPTLEALDQENEVGKILKRKFWECLKKMFTV